MSLLRNMNDHEMFGKLYEMLFKQSKR